MTRLCGGRHRGDADDQRRARCHDPRDSQPIHHVLPPLRCRVYGGMRERMGDRFTPDQRGALQDLGSGGRFAALPWGGERISPLTRIRQERRSRPGVTRSRSSGRRPPGEHPITRGSGDGHSASRGPRPFRRSSPAAGRGQAPAVSEAAAPAWSSRRLAVPLGRITGDPVDQRTLSRGALWQRYPGAASGGEADHRKHRLHMHPHRLPSRIESDC